MKRSIAAAYIDRYGRTPRWMRWVVLTFFCEADTPAPRWHRALRLALWAVLALGLVMMAERLNAQEPPSWWAERVVCLPSSDMPWTERCGQEQIGPFEQERCPIDGASAWALERERLEKAGWGGLEFGPLSCVYRGGQTVS